MSFPTTRQHPRTLAQAFPAERAPAGWIYRAPGLGAWFSRLLRRLVGIA